MYKSIKKFLLSLVLPKYVGVIAFWVLVPLFVGYVNFAEAVNGWFGIEEGKPGPFLSLLIAAFALVISFFVAWTLEAFGLWKGRGEKPKP